MHRCVWEGEDDSAGGTVNQTFTHMYIHSTGVGIGTDYTVSINSLSQSFIHVVKPIQQSSVHALRKGPSTHRSINSAKPPASLVSLSLPLSEPLSVGAGSFPGPS